MRAGYHVAAGAVFAASLVAAPSFAQEGPPIKPAGADGLPEAITHATATKDGGLLLIPVRKNGESASLVTVRSSGPDAFVVEPASFDARTFGSPTFEHAAQDNELTTWAVASEQVLWRGPASGWSLIRAGDQDKTACVAWQRFGTTCSVLAPIANQRAILLRPRYGNVDGKRVLGSEVVALQQGSDEPLATVALPGVALGPAVTDGKGGFWVMLRRTDDARKILKLDPMEGYLHYTAEGLWEMWSDSGEPVEGTELKGRSVFVINPEPRKMAPDMQGGFFAISKDETVYHVEEDGSVDAFSTMQPTCQDCRQIAIAFDASRRELHLISAQWKNKRSGRTFVRGMSYMRFDANGGRVFAEDIPLPPGVRGDDVRLFDSIKLFAEAGQVWVLGRQMLLHRSSQGWRWLGEGQQVAQMLERERAEEAARERAERANPELATLALYGSIGLTTATILGAAIAQPGNVTTTTGNTTSTQGDASEVFAAWGVGALAGLLPGYLFYPNLSSYAPADEIGDTMTWVGAIATPLAVTAGTWVTAEATTAGATWRVDDGFSTRSLLGTAGGAAVGTLSSALLTRLLLDSAGEEVSPLISTFLGTAMTAGFATFGWALTVPRSSSATNPSPLLMPRALPAAPMSATFHLTF